jgi:4-amino-4-deoxy-L-arabinose transferase-like glycosyltransferase
LIDKPKNVILIRLAILLGSALLFLPFLGGVPLFDWDEVNFAEIAREMIVTKDYLNVQINYQPFWEKPPLFMWMQVLAMKLFGVNEFAARFPNAVCGILTLLILFHIGKKVHSRKMGLIWVLVYAGSILPFFYFKSGIIDPWFNLFIFLSVYFATLYLVQWFNGSMVRLLNFPSSPSLLIFLSGASIGLAILTKGPVALLIFGLVLFIYLLLPILPSYRPTVLPSYRLTVLQSYRHIKPLHILLFLTGLAITGGSWFLIMIANGNLDTVTDFIIYQVRLFSTKDAGHGGFPGYHIVILMLGVFPASAFLFGGLKADPDENPLQKSWRRIMIILLSTVIILFEIVQTKIVHYSSLAYFPLTYLAALYIYRIIEKKRHLRKVYAIVLSASAILWMLVIIGFTLVGLNKEWLMNSGLIKDPFAVANLQTDVIWTGWEILVSGVLVFGMVGFFLARKFHQKITLLFGSTILFTFLTMAVFTGKIAAYTQGAVLEFYAERSGEDCYLKTLGYKSYAHLYYGNTLPQENPLADDMNWLLHGNIDKPAYFVYKINRKEEYSRIYPHLTTLYEKNGFIFAVRYPEQ